MLHMLVFLCIDLYNTLQAMHNRKFWVQALRVLHQASQQEVPSRVSGEPPATKLS